MTAVHTLYAAVLALSGEHCGCASGTPSACGDSHSTTGTRCHRGTNHGVRLLVVPVDPMLPLHVAAGLGPDDLMVLCARCATARTNAVAAARERQHAQALADAQISLFDFDAV